VIAGIRAAAAIAGVTWIEAWRARLWAVPLAASALLVLVGPHLTAADPSGRVRLAGVVTVLGAALVAVLVATLLAATQPRRDFELRVALFLFPKPLPAWAYLAGRWLGAVLVAAACALTVAATGSAVMAWLAGGVPQARQAQRAGDWSSVGVLGESVPIPADRSRLLLAGPAGDGMRWTFAGIDPNAARSEVLLRCKVIGADGGGFVDRCRVRVVAGAPGQPGAPAELLADSPFGRPENGPGGGPGEAWIRNREETRQDLGADWMRMRLPPGAVTADGRLEVRLTRLEGAARLEFDRAQGCLIGSPAGPMPFHLARGILGVCAIAGLAAACALCLATVANLGVVLVGCLTLLIAGSAVWAVSEEIAWGDWSTPMLRLMQLAVRVLPDFGSVSPAGKVAAAQAMGWAEVGMAWLTLAPHILIFLIVGLILLERKEH
jgi:hypothetical protein